MKETASIDTLFGIGPQLQKRFAALGITTLHDLIWHLPRAHDDRSDLTALADVTPEQKATVRGSIEQIAHQKGWRGKKAITRARISDDTGSLNVIWFNQPYIAQNLSVGDSVILTGVVKKNAYGTAMQSPEYEKIIPGKQLTHSGRIVPHYPTTAGMTQKQLRYAVTQALKSVLPLPDPLPEKILTTFTLFSLSHALQQIHFPDNADAFMEAQRRIDFERLYILQLAIQQMRAQSAQWEAPVIPFAEKTIQHCVQHLPFTLTAAQKKVAWQIIGDMQKKEPMNRLVEGDVGSGKTIVAGLAMLNAVTAGYQAVLMAPTEIVAKQHYNTLKPLFDAQKKKIVLRTGSEKNDLTGADAIIGTHALIQSGVHFENLGVAVIDEQHRFGVAQRKKLKEHNGNGSLIPHLLSMSATPIPRSLTLALYGDLDISVIDELPAGRLPIITRIIPPKKRSAAYDFIKKRIENGEQAFVICPLIDDSEKLRVAAVMSEYERLQKKIFPDLRLAVLHGKMPSKEKDALMQKMRDGEIDILVTTSVVEVGVDVPNATIMMVEGAERFGLAQLHQLRGRVGRGGKQSYCLLFPTTAQTTSLKRLQALTELQDGFALAKKDVELRGSGDVYGTLQSGFYEDDLRAAENTDLLAVVKEAVAFTEQHSLLEKSPLLQQAVSERLSRIHME